MTTVTADSALQSLFAGLKDRAEVRDIQGNLLGYVTPRQVEEELLYTHATQVFVADEIRRQLAEQPAGISIDQVMTHLHSLGKP